MGNGGNGGGCPVLRGLPPRPARPLAWWQRLFEVTDFIAYHRAALGADDEGLPPLALRPLEERVLEVPPQLVFGGHVMVGDGDLARQVLGGEADGSVVHDNSSLRGMNELLGSESIFVAQEPKHSLIRRLITPAFTSDAVERMLPRMQAVVARFWERWAAETAAAQQEEEGGAVVRPVGGLDALKHMTFEFILVVILGQELEEEESERLRALFTTWSDGLLAWPWIDLGPLTRFGRARRARVQLMEAFQRKVDEARAAVAAGGAANTASIIHSLVAAVDEAGNRLSDLQVTELVLAMLWAGYDSTSVTLTNMLALLEDAPDVVAKLRTEQAAVGAAHGEAISGAALKAMPYAEAVIRETLRMRNVVAARRRIAAKDLTLGGGADTEGIAIPAGTVLNVPISLLQASDPRWAAESLSSPLHPSRFNPDRFASADAQRAQAGWQMPFSAGVRYCSGAAVANAEMKCFMALLARSYDVSVDADTTWTLRLGYVPANGLPMRVARRQAVQQTAAAEEEEEAGAKAELVSVA